jgi:hypothetical protein
MSRALTLKELGRVRRALRSLRATRRKPRSAASSAYRSRAFRRCSAAHNSPGFLIGASAHQSGARKPTPPGASTMVGLYAVAAPREETS